MREGTRVICDCCGRQIVRNGTTDEYTVVSVGSDCLNLGFGKAACPLCAPIERKEQEAWEQSYGSEETWDNTY